MFHIDATSDWPDNGAVSCGWPDGSSKEAISMNMKSLAVIALLVLGCSFASAQTYTFGFADTNGNLYCNYEQIGISDGLILGTDNLSVCGLANNAEIIGGTGKVPLLRQQYSVTVDAILADNILDVEAGTVTYMQACWFQALKCNKQDKNGKYHGKYGWITFAIYDGVVYGDNYGYLSCTIPEKGDGDALMRGTTSGKLLEKLGK